MIQYIKYILKVSSIVMCITMSFSLSSSLADETQPNIVIHARDKRIYNKTMRIEARFKVNGEWHFDWETIDVGEKRLFGIIGTVPFPVLVLDGRGGKKNSEGVYVGDFLRQKDGSDDQLKIENGEYNTGSEKSRSITELSLTISITINNKAHWEYQYIGPFDFGVLHNFHPYNYPCDQEYILTFYGGKWDKKGKAFMGSFLNRHRKDCVAPFH